MDYERWNTLVKLSKRELIEIALRLGALAGDSCDDEEEGYRVVMEELEALKVNRLI